MNTTEFLDKAQELVKVNGGTYTCKVSGRLTVSLGRCHYRRKELQFNRRYVELNDWQVLKNLVLHELAHELCVFCRGHGPTWQKAYRALGGDDSHAGSAVEKCHNIKLPEAKWQAVCPRCGFVHSSRHAPRRSTRVCCGICSTSFDEECLLTFVKNY